MDVLRCLPLALFVALGPVSAAAQSDPIEPVEDGPEANAPDPLLLRLADLTTGLTAAHRPYLELQTGHLGVEQSVYYDLVVEPAACYTFVALGENSLNDLDLHVYAGGVEVVADTAADNSPVVSWCNDVFDRVSTELRAYGGAGRFVFQVLTREGPATGLEATLRATLDARAGRFAAGYRPAASPMRGALATNGRDRWELLLAGGRLYVIVVAGVETATDLDLVLLDRLGRTELDADLNDDAEPVLRYRVEPESGGHYRLEVVMAGGYGEYVVGIYSD